MAAFLEEGVTTFVSLGGDGTNRAIARAASDVDLVPLSTGTNNVFPVLTEPTVAGMAAGLAALGVLPDALSPRCKVLHVEFQDGVADLALVDAAYLAEDFTGNMRPFDATKLRQIMLTRAEPDAIGMSPIGGHLAIVEASDDHGLLLRMGTGRNVKAPVSPGLFRDVGVANADEVPFGTPVLFRGTGVLALDGDRDHKLRPGRGAHVTLRRDGPRVVDVPASMRFAAKAGLLAPARK